MDMDANLDLSDSISIESPSNGIEENEESKLLIEELKRNIKIISDKYKEMPPEKKIEIENKLRNIFKEGFKRKVMKQIGETLSENYLLFSVVLILIVVIFGLNLENISLNLKIFNFFFIYSSIFWI